MSQWEIEVRELGWIPVAPGMWELRRLGIYTSRAHKGWWWVHTSYPRVDPRLLNVRSPTLGGVARKIAQLEGIDK